MFYSVTSIFILLSQNPKKSKAFLSISQCLISDKLQNIQDNIKLG